MAPNHYDFESQWRALGEEVAVGDLDARCTRGGSVGVLLLALPMQPMAPPLSRPTVSPAPKAPYRPPPDHPWRRFHIGRATSPRPSAAASAKL